jgi:dephospho-CoA kinase
MRIVGITGGIGSGKSTVAKMFIEFGIPVYNSDEEAKALMNRSKVIKRKLIKLFGDKAYLDNKINRPYLAECIFNNKDLLEKMNAIVHPKVGQHFQRWLKKHSEAPYVLKESALLFETGGYKQCDTIILVTAPINDRISRVIKRDNTLREKVRAIIDNQSNDALNKSKAHFVINNVYLEKTEREVFSIHKKLLKISRIL